MLKTVSHRRPGEVGIVNDGFPSVISGDSSNINQRIVLPDRAFTENVIVAGGAVRIGRDPGIVSEVSVVKRSVVLDQDVIVRPIESECLTNFARSEGRALH